MATRSSLGEEGLFTAVRRWAGQQRIFLSDRDSSSRSYADGKASRFLALYSPTDFSQSYANVDHGEIETSIWHQQEK